MALRVVLADDHAIVRQGLRALLDEEQDIDLVAEASDGRQAVNLAKEHHPDVVLMDVSMPDLNGIEATRQIAAENNGTKVLVLSAHSDKRYIAEMFRAGASGYLLKDCACEELTLAIRSVAGGGTYLGTGAADVVVGDYLNKIEENGLEDRCPFTSREQRVLVLVAEGMSAKEIALKLDVSVRTVESCRRQLMDKLGVESVAGLTHYAIRAGLTSLGS